MKKKRKVKSEIKEIIRSTNSKNKKLVKNLQTSLSELQRCTVSVAGLEELSVNSIKKIQQERHVKLQKVRRFSMQLNSFEKKITALENNALKSTNN